MNAINRCVFTTVTTFLSLAISPVSAAPNYIGELQELFPAGATGPNAGQNGSVSIDGGRALITSLSGTFGGESGAAHIFEVDGTGHWSEVAKLFPSHGSSTDYFGWRTDLDGDRLIVGALSDEAATNSGSAYIFERDLLGNWTQTARLLPPSGLTGFGYSVSLYGDHAVVGQANPAVFNAGSAFVYKRDALGQWNLEATLNSSSPLADAQFGHSVEIGDGVIGVGAIRHDGFPTPGRSGGAYVFEETSPGVWSEVELFQKSTDFAFGRTISIDGDRMAIGGGNGGQLGQQVRIYEKDPVNGWLETATIQPGDLNASNFGVSSISLDGDKLVVGADEDDTYDTFTGAAYVFEFAGGTWNEIAKFIPTNVSIRDMTGFRVGVSGDYGITSTRGLNVGPGTGYIFRVTPPFDDPNPNPILPEPSTIVVMAGLMSIGALQRKNFLSKR